EDKPRRARSCCARAARGHAIAPPNSVISGRGGRPHRGCQPAGSWRCGETGLMCANMPGVPGWESSYQGRWAVELDGALTGGLGHGELPGVPFDEGFGFCGDVEVLLEAGVRLADLGVSELDE